MTKTGGPGPAGGGRAPNPAALLFRLLFIAAAFASAAASGGAAAAPQIVLSPIRMVLDSQKDRDAFIVSNPSDRIVDVRITWIGLAATERGYRTASPTERTALSAAPYLTVAPASLRLNPGAREEVAVTYARALESAAGAVERRSHLLFEVDPARTALRKTSGGLEADMGLSVSAPVILRAGEARAGAEIDRTRLIRNPEGELVLETTLKRRGAHSLFGRLEAAVAAANRNTIDGERLALIDNVALYTDIDRRTFKVPLGVKTLPESILTLRYVGTAEYEGALFFEKEYAVAEPE